MIRKKLEVTNSTTDIAKTIVNRCLRRGYRIYPEKLEKLLIIAYGEYLVKTKKRLFDSKISFINKKIGIKEIQRMYAKNEEFNQQFMDEKIFFYEVEEILNKVINIYGEKNTLYISNDPRLIDLRNKKRLVKRISDMDVFETFLLVPNNQINTNILCRASEKAKWIVNACLKKGYSINTLKLEKLLILTYCECLVKTGHKMFDEKIVIWEAGPMIREVDRDFRPYVMGFYLPFVEYYSKLYSEENEIDYIIEKYGKMDSFELRHDIKLKELTELKNSEGFVSDEDIKRVFKKYIL